MEDAPVSSCGSMIVDCVEESRGGCVEREIVARRSAVLGGVESASVLSRSDSLAGAGGGKPNGGEHSG